MLLLHSSCKLHLDLAVSETSSDRQLRASSPNLKMQKPLGFKTIALIIDKGIRLYAYVNDCRYYCQGFGSGFWPNSDPGLCASNEGRFYAMNILDNFKILLFWCHAFGVKTSSVSL